ncbi:MAG: GNAT family N-acetyltransferase [Phycisphaerae bacterium]|nr:GNAT family N-acetyltransferase [Phycisphaerae bacterium]
MPRRKISVLILHNSPQSPVGWASAHADKPCAPGQEQHGLKPILQTFSESEAGVLAEVEAVSRALDKLRIVHRVVGVRSFEELPGVLSASDEPVVFNLVEGFWSDTKLCNLVPTVIRSFGKACTGNDAQGLLFSLDKWQCKTLLAAAGIPTPQGLIVPPGRPIPTRDLFEGPYIVKPVQTDASEGIDKTSIVRGRGKTLRQVVQRIHDQLAQPALIEQYIDGRELNISVISRVGRASPLAKTGRGATDELEVLPLAEIDFSAFEAGRPRIVGYEAKWLEDSFEYHHTPRIIPAPLPKRLTERIRELAAASCRALSCFEYCRVDFRLDKANRPYVLEVNANPDISRDAGFAAAIEAAGMSYAAFVKLIIDNAVKRSSQSVGWGLPHHPTRGGASPTLQTGDRQPTTIDIRWCRPEDRQVVLSFLAETGFFHPDEIEIARELIDSAIAEGPKGHYQSFVACVDRGPDCGLKETPGANPQSEIRNPKSVPVGWVCWGPAPCTLGTFDIYWLGVASNAQGQGIGRALTNFAEQAIAERGGRLFVVETSSRETYTPTRRFYEALGYREAGRIPDFYGPGDDRVIFLKAAKDSSTGNKR